MSMKGDVLREVASQMPTDPTDARAWLIAKAHEYDLEAASSPFPPCAPHCSTVANQAHEIRVLKGIPASFTGENDREKVSRRPRG